jgi:hypothetical protein
MNRTARRLKREHNRKLSRIVLSIGGLLLLVMAAFVFFQNNDFSGGTPRLAVDQQKIDWGTVKDGTNKVITITVTNIGNGTLRFKEKPYVQVVEGCCPPDMSTSSMVLKPGESATVTSVEFFMHPGMDGKHNYAVHLITNDPTQPDKVVNVLSNWVQ